MKLIKYQSIDNYSSLALHRLQKRNRLGLRDTMFTVTEKIHGANFSIHSRDGVEIRYAKRNNFLEDGNFFNFQEVVARHKTGIQGLTKQLHEGGLKYAIIYGELCGGSYDGVPKNPRAKRVQKEVQYSSNNEFIVFDIAFFDDNKLFYLDQVQVEELCNEHKLNCVRHEYIGTLSGCIAYAENNLTRNSVIPEMFGLPPLPLNPIEGFVIKQMTGGTQEADSRIAFKVKAPKFRERNVRQDKTPKENNFLDYSLVQDHLNINRFNSATSKYGEYTIKDFGNILQLIAEDIATEASIPNSKQLKAIVAQWMKANSKDLF